MRFKLPAMSRSSLYRVLSLAKEMTTFKKTVISKQLSEHFLCNLWQNKKAGSNFFLLQISISIKIILLHQTASLHALSGAIHILPCFLQSCSQTRANQYQQVLDAR